MVYFRLYHFKLFKDYPPQISLGPLLSNMSHIWKVVSKKKKNIRAIAKFSFELSLVFNFLLDFRSYPL